MQRLPPRSTRTDTLFPARLSSVLRKINPPCFGKVAVAGHLAKRPFPSTGRPVPVARGFRNKTPEKEGNSMVPRYARPEMTAIWSAENRFRIWFEIEAHATDALAELGTVPKSAAKALWDWWATNPAIDVAAIDAIEAVTKHDVIAFLPRP